MNKSVLSYFTVAFVCTAIGLVLAGFVGHFAEVGIVKAIFLCTVLSILEISLSFDNAVVNASVLGRMTPVWRHRFLTWGILIAVFGMRLFFPLAIVSFMGQLGPVETLKLAATDPEGYAGIMTKAHVPVAAFGGAFLLMVALRHFMSEHANHWIKPVEKVLASFRRIKFADIMTAALVIAVLSFFTEREFLYAAISGLVAFVIVDGLSSLLGGGHGEKTGVDLHRASAGLFIYLEVLDASFSFDGVIGAFAITTSLFLITLGLGIGAFYVRSLTIMLVERGTLNELKYLEQGAFWAIFTLAAIMFISIFAPVPEIITGTIGALLIGASIWSSLKEPNPKVPIAKSP